MSELSNLFKKVYAFENSKKQKKIDIFVDGNYVCSTTRSKTCKVAVAKFIDLFGQPDGKVTARFTIDK